MELFGRCVDFKAVSGENTDHWDKTRNELFLRQLEVAAERKRLVAIMWDPGQTGAELYYRTKIVTEQHYHEHMPMEVFARLLGIVKRPHGGSLGDYYTPSVVFLREALGELLIKGTCNDWHGSARGQPPVNVFRWRRRLFHNFFSNPDFPYTAQVFRLFSGCIAEWDNFFYPERFSLCGVQSVAPRILQWNHLTVVQAPEMPRFTNRVARFGKVRMSAHREIFRACLKGEEQPFLALIENGYTEREEDLYTGDTAFLPVCPRGRDPLFACWGASDVMGDFVGGYGCDGLLCQCPCHGYRQLLFCTSEYCAEKIAQFTERPLLRWTRRSDFADSFSRHPEEPRQVSLF